jgi:hypothetical protein
MEIRFPISYTVKDEEDLAEIQRVLAKLPIELDTEYCVRAISKKTDSSARGADLIITIDTEGERFEEFAYQALLDEEESTTRVDVGKETDRLDTQTLEKILKVTSKDAVVETVGDSRFISYFDSEELYRVYVELDL